MYANVWIYKFALFAELTVYQFLILDLFLSVGSYYVVCDITFPLGSRRNSRIACREMFHYLPLVLGESICLETYLLKIVSSAQVFLQHSLYIAEINFLVKYL